VSGTGNRSCGEIEVVESVSCEDEHPRPKTEDAAARKRAAVETYARNETALRRTARRFSLCEDDADEALQRGLEILLRKAPSSDPRQLVKWTQTVVRHEALAVRQERERILPAAATAAGEDDWVALLPSGSDGPPERAERREAVARSREALQALKPQELRALTLLAEGYSYAEIGEITSWSHTKINRCIAEGRERFRSLVAGSEDGSRCATMRPLISSFCDGEATAEDAATVREHLRACAPCRATMRSYRSAPAAAAALAPLLPLSRSLLDRARGAFAELAGRFAGGGRGDALSQVAGASGPGGVGAAALAKAATICIGAAGGATACIASGLVPVPLDLGKEATRPPQIERPAGVAKRSAAEAVAYDPAPAAAPPAAAERKPKRAKRHRPRPLEPAPAPAEPAPAGGEPAVESAPVESSLPPEPPPEAEPTPVTSPTSGSPAGEFGP
jgi:RNA polymerase sigma factor (sigma-70 family)